MAKGSTEEQELENTRDEGERGVESRMQINIIRFNNYQRSEIIIKAGKEEEGKPSISKNFITHFSSCPINRGSSCGSILFMNWSPNSFVFG